MTIPGFEDHQATLNGTRIAWSMGGSGAPLLLLHGFPQTRALWARIAPELAKTHQVVCPDLRGYGDSAKPESVSAYSFRQMANDQRALMAKLGHDSFAVAGHDRGARVAHRLTLDVPQAVSRLCVMDIIPTHTLLADLRMDVAKAYYHWFFLAQPAPFPEQMIAANPDRYYESCLLGWGAARLEDFDACQLAAYRTAWRDPDTIRGMCNDYRAALSYDMADDTADLGAQVICPTLVLYGKDGSMAKAYDIPATWANICTNKRASALPGGHFFVDCAPAETLDALRGFLA